jgi:hypothetical protein
MRGETMPMSDKDQALRISFVAFRRMMAGYTYNQKELETLSNLAILAVPGRYRFTRQELEALKKPKGEPQ